MLAHKKKQETVNKTKNKQRQLKLQEGKFL